MIARWHAAYRVSPCDCGVDGDYLIDEATGDPIAWRCNLCHQSGPVEQPSANRPPRFRPGQRVTLQHGDEIVRAVIVITSRNGRAIAVEFDGVIANCVNMLPLQWDEDSACFRTIIDDQPITIRDHEHATH